MPIPSPLAFPPTALRNVAAGLVVGNPIGSGGTRGKALTAAELKAIVEASGISYLPLAGGTLTGPITGTGGLIEQRDGLTAQCFDLFETYTSSTNNGKLRFKATSSGHQIGSARATGGSNRPIQIGHFDSSNAFTCGLEVDTNGYVNVKGAAPFLTFNTSVERGYILHGGPLSIVNLVAGNAIKLQAAAGVQVELVNGSPARLTCGQFISVAPSLVSLATNGQFSVEMTSNTAGNLVYRGSDGTTRRMALTFI